MTSADNPIAKVIRDKGMSVEQIAEECDISVNLVEILLKGGVTIPRMALQIGEALEMDIEDVKKMGVVLNRRLWTMELGADPGNDIDFSEKWYEKYNRARTKARREKKNTPEEMYPDNIKMLEWALNHSIGMREMLRRCGWDYSYSRLCKAKGPERMQVTRRIAKMMRIPYESLLVIDPGEAIADVYYTPDIGRIFQRMKSKGLTMNSMARLCDRSISAIYKALNAEAPEKLNYETAKMISDAVGLSIPVIFKGEIIYGTKIMDRTVTHR